MASLEKQFERAVAAYRAGKYIAAKKMITKMEREVGAHPQILHLKAFIEIEVGTPQIALNALNQAAKELSQRFDFKNTGASIEWQGELGVELEADTEERVLAALEVFRDKLVKRSISLKALDAGEPRSSGRTYKITCALTAGISQEQAKKLGKIIRDDGPKKVKVAVQGEELRVSSSSRDDLQTVIALVQEANLDFPVQFVNYR